MPRFDPKKPFSEVFGIHAAKYYQNGFHFNAQHKCLDGSNDEEEIKESPVLNEEPDAPAEHEVGETGQALMEDAPAVPADTEPAAPTAEELGAMNWRDVKTYVEVAGGTWTNKKDGIVFLTS